MKKEAKQKQPPKERPRYNLWQNTAYMAGLAWQEQKSVLALCLLQALFFVGLNLVNLFIAPSILGAVEDRVPLEGVLGTIAFFVLALLVLNILKTWVATNTLFGRIAVRLKILAEINKKFARTSYPNTEDPAVLKKRDKAGEAVGGNSQATEAVWDTLAELLQSTAGFVIYLLLLSALDPVLIVITAVTTLAGYFAGKRINGWGWRHREEEAQYIHKLNYVGVKADDRALAKDVRIFGMRGWLEEIHQKYDRLYQDFIGRRERVYLWADVVDVLMTLLRNGAAYAYLLGITLTQGLTAAEFLLYFTAVGGFTAWVTGILSGFTTLYKQSLDISTVREFLELQEPFRFEDGEALEPEADKPYEIELKDVRFRYPGAEADTLKGINLKIRAGEKLAVVGLNGAGKTTLIKLICGFYDPTEGEVLMNGENIKRWNRRDYYRHFSAVFQSFSILAGTLAENIAQTDEGIDPHRLDGCVRKAGLAEKLQALPWGAETHIGKEVYEDGVELSGGEKQRLMLARALYKDAPVIVLDEPTAALDPLAESELYQKYNELTEGRTSVYISHRLASTQFCDRIVYLEDGKIMEEGTHRELLGRNGAYARLFELQSRYYRKGGVPNAETVSP